MRPNRKYGQFTRSLEEAVANATAWANEVGQPRWVVPYNWEQVQGGVYRAEVRPPSTLNIFSTRIHPQASGKYIPFPFRKVLDK